MKYSSRFKVVASYHFCLLALLIFLTSSVVLAESSSLKSIDKGLISLPFGALYVPGGFIWSEIADGDQMTLIGRNEESQQLLVVVSLNEEHDLESNNSVELVEKYISQAQNPARVSPLRIKNQLSAPYPWPGSLELRLDGTTPESIYIGSGSGHTLLVSATGSKSEQLANFVTGSFKESFNSSRASQVKNGIARKYHSMLGTASTFLLSLSVLIPLGLTLFRNRREKKNFNPFLAGLKGLALGFVIILIFDVIILYRLSWAGAGDYLQALGTSLTRAIFLSIIAAYFSRQWQLDSKNAE